MLHRSIGMKDEAAALWILECAQSEQLVNMVDEEGWSPLHSACSSGMDTVVAALLAKGGDVSVRTSGG